MSSYLYALLVACIIYLSQVAGLNGLYYHYPAYDIFMHIVGGFGIGLFASSLIKSAPDLFQKRRKTLVVITVIFIGLVWEAFEVVFEISGHPFGTNLYYIDTVKDLADDIIGGIIAAWISFRK